MDVNTNKVFIIFTFLGMMAVWETQGILTCLEHWSLYEKEHRCVRIFTSNSRTWDGARVACKMYGGDLIRVDSEAKNEFLETLHKRHRVTGWIGLHRFESNLKYFHWLDDTTKVSDYADYTFWSWGEPNSEKERCVSMMGWHTRWNDYDCNQKKSYVCEMDAIHKPPPLCPENWKGYGTSCFRLYTDSQTWSEARNRCQSEQGDLAVIPNEDTNNFLANNVYPDDNFVVYFGASDQEQEGIWKWVKPDVSLDQYANWVRTEPDNNGNEDCLVISGRNKPQWEDAMCKTKYSYICEKPSITYNLICPEGWYLHSEYCFREYEELKSWTDARDNCRDEGGRLATVADKPTRDALEMVFWNRFTRSVWVGLNDLDGDGEYTWVDSRETNTDWVCESCLSGKEQGCVVTKWPDGWSEHQVSKVESCNMSFMYLCEKDAERSPHACPPGWSLYNKYCFKLHQTEMNFTDARQVCASEKGHLAAIPDRYTHSFLTGEFSEESRHGIFIGLNDIDQEGVFVWDGTNLTIPRTGYGSPYTVDTTEDCVIFKGGRFHIRTYVECQNKFPFLCQMDAPLAELLTSPPSPTRATTDYNNPARCGNGGSASALKNTDTAGSSSSSSGLSLGGLAGIFVAVFVIVAAIGVTVYLLRRRKATSTTEEFAAYHPMNDGSA